MLEGLASIILVIIFISAMLLKPSNNQEILKYFSPDFLLKANVYNRTVLLISAGERLLSWIFTIGIIFIFWKNIYINNRIPVFKKIKHKRKVYMGIKITIPYYLSKYTGESKNLEVELGKVSEILQNIKKISKTFRETI